MEIREIPAEMADEYFFENIKYLNDDGIVTYPEDLEYFSSEEESRSVIREQMKRNEDRHHLVWFEEEGTRIGAASYCIYKSEDGKCFILDFWVFPQHRGNGTGHRCFEALERYTRSNGARYYELNSEKEDSVRFWRSLGFTENGADEYGMPLFIRR